MAEQQFDVFLCHNSEDKPAVIQIAQQLRTNGLKPWLDVWELQPGGIWQFELEQQIESINAAAVFVGQQGLGPWQSEEIYAFLQEFIRRKCPVIPVMLHDAPKQPRLPIFLKNRHWVDFRLQEPDPLVQLVWGITGKRPDSLQMESKTAEVISIQEPNPALPPSAVHEELEALRRELEALRANQQKTQSSTLPPSQFVSVQPSKPPAPKPSEDDDLSSEKGIDYTQLRDLLKAGEWKEADQETYEVMIRTVGKKSGDWFTSDELLNFPCADLKTIDRLWVKYSNGQFGFSVQKEIYVQCGGKLDGNYPGAKIWDEFCDRIGWRVNGSYISYSRVTFSTSAPRRQLPGHLPCAIYCMWVWVSLLSHPDLQTVADNRFSPIQKFYFRFVKYGKISISAIRYLAPVIKL